MRLATKEQIVINAILDTMVMEIHVLSVALTRTTPPGGSAAAATDCKFIYFRLH